jgi:hypothetical protein
MTAAALIQPPLPILDLNRLVECASCRAQTSVYDLAAGEGSCPGCGRQICSFCGCTEERACIHPEYGYPCSWYDVGVCIFCHYEIAEANYIAVTEGPEHVRPFTPRLRPGVLPGSHLGRMQEVIKR